MDTYKIRLESLYTEGKQPAYHVARYEDDSVYDPQADAFVDQATLPAGHQAIVPLAAGTGLYIGLSIADLKITPAFTDGWYCVYYHDALLHGEPIITYECFQVRAGKCDPVGLSQVANELLSQLKARNFRLNTMAG